MKLNENNLKQCPTFEEISTYFDGINEVPGIDLHIEECAACRKTLQDIAELDAAIKARANIPQEDIPQLTARIKDGFYRKNELEPAKYGMPFPRVVLHLAAALAICSAVVYVAVQGLTDDMRSANIADPAQDAVAASQIDKFPYYTSNGSGVLNSNGSENSVEVENLIPANYGSSEPVMFNGGVQAGAQKINPVIIRPKVDHVWVVKNISKADDTLKRMIKNSGTPLQLRQDGSVITMQGRLNKLELVKLVRACSNAGFELVSPVAPQPEQHYFKGNSGEPVNYQAQFLVNKGSR
ncbi:hypothetical protein P0136_13490 [Lentisphaerota bacterium ZTH]|nr:hypothetical protein JYG24_08995 [Lentisphaerota bacterium]WET06371.1 hypothetical protein P0136_13490 [Lentisphaerota bacterium ZTH]